jgi:hypothetical protein
LAYVRSFPGSATTASRGKQILDFLASIPAKDCSC